MLGETLRLRSRSRAGFVPILLAVLAIATSARADLPIDQEPIRYYATTARDPVARLQERIDRGEVTLTHDGERQGYLRSVLEGLGIAPESQALVFSKTSFQHTRISPRTPRALYFGDDAYVGWVKGGDVLELAAVDPQLGTVFYLLDQQEAERPKFLRQSDSCLQCHISSKTQDVPGLLVRSVFPDRRGYPIFSAGSFVTDHTSPLKERWGGWYVTGSHGGQRHMGNVVAEDRKDPHQLDTEAGANRADLQGLVDTHPYLTGHSDIVALMVLEHQTQMHNLITLANYQARIGLHYDAGINKALGQPPDTLSESTGRRIKNHAEKLVRYMLFCGETRLTEPIEGTSGFAAQFSARRPRDAKGRSLRDFDLQTRLFKYPCSYLIQSEAFDALPKPVKDRVLLRLGEILIGKDQGPEFAHLSSEDRKAILEILRDTRPEWGLGDGG
jgi:hypothetical protein